MFTLSVHWYLMAVDPCFNEEHPPPLPNIFLCYCSASHYVHQMVGQDGKRLLCLATDPVCL